jgi:hypothetical protein
VRELKEAMNSKQIEKTIIASIPLAVILALNLSRLFVADAGFARRARAFTPSSSLDRRI